MGKRNSDKRKSNKIVVTPQTLYHLHEMSELCGYKTIGRVVDKLVREKRAALHMQDVAEEMRRLIRR